MKYILYLSLIFLSSVMSAQVGVGNTSPRGILDVNDNPNADATNGLVLPHTDDVTTLINPADNNALSEVPGTIAFDKTDDCIKFIKNDGTWSDCITVEQEAIVCPTSETLTIEQTPTGSVCGGSTLQLSSSFSSGSYQWTASGGATIDDATSSSPIITLPDADVDVVIDLQTTTIGCDPEQASTSVTLGVLQSPNISIQGIVCRDVEVTDSENDSLNLREEEQDVFTGLTYTVGTSTGATSFSWRFIQNPGDFATIVSGGDTHTATVDFTKSFEAVGTYILQVELEGLECGRLTRLITIDIRDGSCNCTTQIVEVISPITGRIWMDRDLGAKSKLTAGSPATDFGCLFEYARDNDGHADIIWTETGGTLPPERPRLPGPAGTPPGYLGLNSLWFGVDAPHNPCPAGFRIPMDTEIFAEFSGAIEQGNQWALGGTEEGDWFTSRRYGYHDLALTELPLPEQVIPTTYYTFYTVVDPSLLTHRDPRNVFWVFRDAEDRRDWNLGFLFASSGFDQTLFRNHRFPIRCIKD